MSEEERDDMGRTIWALEQQVRSDLGHGSASDALVMGLLLNILDILRDLNRRQADREEP